MNPIELLKKATELQIAGEISEAEKIYNQVLAQYPDNIDAKHLLGLVRGEQDREEEAVSLIEEAIRAKPEESAFHHNIAGIYRRMGQIEKAEQEFRRAIDLKPDYGEAYQGLAEVVKFEKGDPVIDQTVRQIQRLDLADTVKSYFYFAAAKMHEDIGDYDTAFRCYQSGNSMADRKFAMDKHRQSVKDHIYIFSKYYFKGRPDEGLDSELPVFVVGMPRSGTTLVEQILASHSKIFGAGELNEIKRIAASSPNFSQIKAPYPHCMPMLKQGAINSMAEDYLNQIRSLTDMTGITRIVDKHPLNFLNIGLILMMFPNAKIIHTTRDPLDTCLSCFFQNFTRGQDYSFNLNQLGHFYNDYCRLMEHWQMLYPDRILALAYESLIENQASESRRLIDFCGLEWEDNCLEFHKTKRTVKTASFMQIRQPIYKSSKGRWQNYRNHIGPLAQILGINLASYGTNS
jgi:tetratricopeptide (TPR) repeat protein